MITGDGRRRYVPAGENPRADRDDKLVLVRNQPITVALNAANTPAANGNPVDCACELLLRWQPREDDLAALERALLGEPLTLERLTEVVINAGALVALRKYISEQPAEYLLQDDKREELLNAFREQLGKFTFETGMVFERIGKLVFVSDAYEWQAALQRETRQRVERIKAAEMIDKAALAATQRRLGDLGGILEQLKTAAGDEKTKWHELLPALSPGDRGKLLENLWRLTPDKKTAEALVVVSGNECLWLDPSEPERIILRTKIPGDMGGLRSITYCQERNWLLVGAASGVWVLDAGHGEAVSRFEVPGIEPPRTGFNAAVVMGERLYATSSQLGCWSWNISDSSDAKPVLAPESGVPKRVRAVVATADGRVLFAADDCVQVYDPASEQLSVLSSGTDVIYSLAVLEDKLFVGTADAKLFRVDMHHSDDWWLVYQANDAIETIEPRRWSDLVELVVPAGPRGINGIYDTEGVTTRLLEARTPIRRAWACDDVVMGLNHLRDRLIVMNANLPERTGREAKIAQMTGQTIQDACIVVRRDVSA